MRFMKKMKRKNYKIRDIKNFLEKQIYEDISKYKRKVKKKINEDDFMIPKFKDYKKIVDLNYNVKQLKKICKRYSNHNAKSK